RRLPVSPLFPYTTLFRSEATDGSGFKGTPDYFVDVAFPISVLIANGVVGSADELGQALFFPATAIAPTRHNKDYLNCPFLPATPDRKSTRLNSSHQIISY